MHAGFRYGNVWGMEADHPLTEFRKRAELTMAELAERLGVDKGTVSRWESGERFPDRALWPRIKEVTGLSGGDLADAIASKVAAQ